jgi:hypothetical protein
VFKGCKIYNIFKSLLVVYFQSNLANDPVYFNCYPNFTMLLSGPNIWKTLTLNIKISTNILNDFISVALIYKIYYKVNYDIRYNT